MNEMSFGPYDTKDGQISYTIIKGQFSFGMHHVIVIIFIAKCTV